MLNKKIDKLINELDTAAGMLIVASTKSTIIRQAKEKIINVSFELGNLIDDIETEKAIDRCNLRKLAIYNELGDCEKDDNGNCIGYMDIEEKDRLCDECKECVYHVNYNEEWWLCMKLNLAILGYTTKLSYKGLAQLARNNAEQVLKCDIRQGYLILKDGTNIKALNYGDIDQQMRGTFIDQLILFDDDRWDIGWDKAKEIDEILTCMSYRSRVPEDFRFIQYEDVRYR